MYIKNIRRIALLAITLLLVCSFLQAEADSQILIKAGKLIDVATGTVLENQMVLVENDRIKSVGPALEIPGTATVIDLSDSVILPGLIDCHVHVDGEASGDHYRTMFQRSFVDNAIVAHIYARRTLDAGFTSVRSLVQTASWTLPCVMPSTVEMFPAPGYRLADSTFPQPADMVTWLDSPPG